ncbi:MAG TPA: S9 family peptidase [Puia sp.]|nr:S9 family peptidase [Puia sp.]
MKQFIACICVSLALSQAYAQIGVPGPAMGKPGADTLPGRRRPLRPSDIYRMKTIGDCQVSPEGSWIAYTLSTVDSAKDKTVSHIWMSSWDGQTHLPVTSGKDGAESPRWSPDGKYLSFLSDRGGEEDKDDDGKSPETSRFWLLDRRGGEAQKVFDIKGKVTGYAWSPDGKKIAVIIKDPNYADTAKSKTRKPFVMDKYHFKQDIEGYLEGRTSHLYCYDLTSKKWDTLTRGKYEESSPAWSPDSKQLAFVSNRSPDPDKNENQDIWLINASGGVPTQLTTWKGSDTHPVWSPDGRTIAYLQSNSEDSFAIYNQTMLATITPAGGKPRIFTRELDRPVSDPKWSMDGSSIVVLVTDDRQAYPAAYSIRDGAMERLATGDCSYSQVECRKTGGWAAIMSTPLIPGELYGLQQGKARRITHLQDSYLSQLQLATVKGFQSVSSDGTKVSGILYTPPGYAQSGASPSGGPASAATTGAAATVAPLPLVLFIHGGPSAQDDYSFDLERQTLAAAGFAVAAVNYRGSNGRGVDYCSTIRADWGNKEVKDILGAANYLITAGIADSARMGIAGWSYGGILTDYVIATDPRFRAASSGAGSALQLSMYGVDEYVNQYDNELGTPWTHLDKWLALSYPFLKADRIRTPTLFMASQSDFNVPSVGAEQMYQALRTLGIPTQLVIYPGQFHEITVPSYQADRLQRWIDWFKKYLK